MATKTKPRRAKKSSRHEIQSKARQRSSQLSVAPIRQSLHFAAKQAAVQVKRVGEEYIAKATELEAARIEQRVAERERAAFLAAEAARGNRPYYNFLAQGDSWFSYTCGFALIHWLQTLFKPENAYFDNIARSGRTLRQMLSREFKHELVAGPPNGKSWSGILLSGGGNDICGDHRFLDWLKPNDGGVHPADWYIESAFEQELKILKGIYEEAIALVSKLAPGVKIFAHDYDFAIPDGRCVKGRSKHLRSSFSICFAGPWMWPAFEQRGFHTPGNPVEQITKDIVTVVLRRFGEMLAELERTYPNQFAVVPTQNTLKPIHDVKLWANELHPYDSSFKLLAQPFYDKLRSSV